MIKSHRICVYEIVRAAFRLETMKLKYRPPLQQTKYETTECLDDVKADSENQQDVEQEAEFRLRAVLRCIRIDGLGFKYI